MIGIPLTKNSIDSATGGAAVAVDNSLTRAHELKFYLDGSQDADLIALGYTSAEVASIRSALSDMDQLYTIYQGAGAMER